MRHSSPNSRGPVSYFCSFPSFPREKVKGKGSSRVSLVVYIGPWVDTAGTHLWLNHARNVCQPWYEPLDLLFGPCVHLQILLQN